MKAITLSKRERKAATLAAIAGLLMAVYPPMGVFSFFYCLLLPPTVAALAGRRPFAFAAWSAFIYWMWAILAIICYGGLPHLGADIIFFVLLFFLVTSMISCIPVYIWQRVARTRSEAQSAIVMLIDTQLDILAKGAEIEPPWVVIPNSEPWEYKRGAHLAFRDRVWEPYWEKLAPEERTSYLAKWRPPERWQSYLEGDDTEFEGEEN